MPYSIYNNHKFGFKISFPPDWEVKQKVMDTIVAFIEPEYPDSIFRGNLNLVIVETLESLREATENTINEIKEIPEAEIIKLSRTKIGEYKARSIIYTGIRQGYELEWMHILTKIENKVYIFTYTNVPKSFKLLKPIIMQMINSFSIV